MVSKQMSDSGAPSQGRTPKEKSSFFKDVSDLLKGKVSLGGSRESPKVIYQQKNHNKSYD